MPMTYRTGPHGEKVSLLGFGMMRLPTVDGAHANTWAKGFSKAAIDQEKVNYWVRYALDHGLNYFDTAPVYCRGESEASTGTALAASGYDRKDYLIATKLSNYAPETWPLAPCKEMFERSLKNLRTDYVDFYLLHYIGSGGYANFRKRFVDNGAIDWLVEERKAGRIRNLGFSFHGDVKTWDWMMENHAKYHWDFAQIQLNYVDWNHAKEVNALNENAAKLYADLDERAIPAVVMEPLLGGRLARFNYTLAAKLAPLDPAVTQADWAFRFCGSKKRVLTILSGMACLDHLEENCASFSPLKPLAAEQEKTLEAAAEAYLHDATVPCTGCEYCMPCPYGLDIPKILGYWNRAVAENRLPDAEGRNEAAARAFLTGYEREIPPLRRAERCTGCGRCAPHCPQAIDVPSEIKKIDAFVENLRRRGSR